MGKPDAQPHLTNSAQGWAATRNWPPRLGVVAWMVAIGLLLLTPQLRHGLYLGPFDLLSQSGVLHRPGASMVPGASTDLINEIIPWTVQAWTQVHQGHLPLWNPNSGLGMPLAFNWQSAPFSLPSVIGYLAPVQLAYDVGIVVTLVVTGSGFCFLGRVIGLGWLGAVAAGTIFELSGAFVGLLGYPLGAVLSWTGWVLAAVVLVVQGRQRARAVALLAVVVACAMYAGNPETVILLAFVAAVFLVLLLGIRLRRRAVSAVVRPVLDLAVAVVAGLALSAPLLLPGYQLASGTLRNSLGGGKIFGVSSLTSLLMPASFAGGPAPAFLLHYQGYVGAIAIALSVLAVARRWRRPAVMATTAVVVVCGALVAIPWVDSIVGLLPFLHLVYWMRALVPLAGGLALLAGVGIDIVVHDDDRLQVRRWLAIGVGVAALYLLGLWLFGRGAVSAAYAHSQNSSFVWPTVLVLVGVAGVLLLDRPSQTSSTDPEGDARRALIWRRSIAGVLVLAETAFLMAQGVPALGSSTTFFASTPASTALVRAVGTANVGFGSGDCLLRPVVGIPPESNIAYNLHEMAIYDPVIPPAYFSSWRLTTGQSGGIPVLATYCPLVTSSAVARQFGVEYVLTVKGASPPIGAVFVEMVGDELLFRVPGAGAATLAPLGIGGVLPADSVAGRPVSVSTPSPSTWRLTTSSDSPQALRLHLTDVPGWSATIDGRPLALTRYSGLMLQARVPAGQHQVEVVYWPPLFTLGLFLAAVSALGLLLGVAIEARRRRSSPADVS